jgi:hypothetical protein
LKYSGSYVMAYVLADQHNWLSSSSGDSKKEEPFSVVPSGDFAALRKAVRQQPTTADFFMWEHFTTKAYWDNGELKRIGEIYTPWPSWMVAARDPSDTAVASLLEKLNEGVKYYLEKEDEAVSHITSTMEYSKDDAKEWMGTVKFAQKVKGVKTGVVDDVVKILRKAGVLDGKSGAGEEMVALKA